MGFWMALLYDRSVRKAEVRTVGAWRRELVAEAHGTVLELGTGTGLNLPHYRPDGIDRLVLSEPDRHMRKRLEHRIATLHSHAEISPATADALPFPDASFDTVVSTLVLCTVADLERSLGEVRRVLRPGGRLLFVEHVAADHDERLLRWQRRLEPIWHFCAEGCCLTRRTEAAIAAAGFAFERLAHDEMVPAPAVVRRVIRGVAR